MTSHDPLMGKHATAYENNNYNDDVNGAAFVDVSDAGTSSESLYSGKAASKSLRSTSHENQ